MSTVLGVRSNLEMVQTAQEGWVVTQTLRPVTRLQTLVSTGANLPIQEEETTAVLIINANKIISVPLEVNKYTWEKRGWDMSFTGVLHFHLLFNQNVS